MQSTAKDVTTYIDEAPAERQETLQRLCDLCRKLLRGFEETMDYGGPSYKRDGEVEVGFASQKHCIGLYILRTDVMSAHRNLLKGKGISTGKGVIRYSQPERIDFSVVESMLRGTVASTGPVCQKFRSLAWSSLKNSIHPVAEPSSGRTGILPGGNNQERNVVFNEI